MTLAERISALFEERRFVEAVELARQRTREEPDDASFWWDLGVALKHAHLWPECLAACERAIALDPDDCAGPQWNSGIAATALGDWPRARAAWTSYGIDVPRGDGPLEMDIGNCCVRVFAGGNGEVVWCRRIDPCRARILSVPLPESDHRHGDIVLHDGEPRGKRGDATVFDELVLLERSCHGTWSVEVTCKDAAERDELLARFDDVDGGAEDWTESVVLLCQACSLGEPHDHEPPPEKRPWRVERRFGIALADAREIARLGPVRATRLG